MILSKAWLFLLGLAVAGLLIVAMVLPRPSQRAIEVEQVDRLRQARQSAQLLLKINARSRMDLAAQLATDPTLGAALEELARGGKDPALKTTVLERLQAYCSKLKLAFLVALDTRGRVVARVAETGREESTNWGDSIAGFPLVSDAVRGYRGEDAWLVGGEVYRTAASPVIGKGHDRYVGALLLGARIGDDLAQTMRDVLGCEVAFFARGNVVASTLPRPEIEELQGLGDRRTDEVSPIGPPGHDFFASIAPLPGEAARQEVAYALLLPRKSIGGFPASLRALRGEDLRSGSLPWVLIGLVSIIALTVAMFLLWFEAEGPIDRLRDEVANLAAGSVSKLDERAYRGRFADIVRALNSALERFETAAYGSAPTVPARPAADAPPASARPASPFANEPPLGGKGARIADSSGPKYGLLPESSGPKRSPIAEKTPSPKRSPLLPEPPLRGASLESGRGALLPDIPPVKKSPSAPPASAAPLAALLPPEPGSSPRMDLGSASGPGPSRPRRPTLGVPLEPDLFEEGATATVAKSLAHGGPGTAKTLVRDEAPTRVNPSADYIPTRVAPPSSELRQRSVPPLPESGEDDVRKIYEEFTELKRKCGEAPDNVSFEKFSAKLKENREQLMQKLRCKSVRFQVYVKDGRAALKALPVRE